MNEYTIANAFEFADEFSSIPMNEVDVLVSYDMTTHFIHVPLSGLLTSRSTKLLPTIGLIKPMILILPEKEELAQLLEVATANQLSSSMVNCMSRLTV